MTEVVWVALGAGILLGAALTILGLRIHHDLVFKKALRGDISLLCSDDISLAYLIVQADSGEARTITRQLSDELSDIEDRLALLETTFVGKEPGGDGHQEG